MTTPNAPRLEGQPPPATRLRAAEPAAPRTAVGGPEGAARKGVLSVLRSDPRQGDGRYPVAWLHIAAPNGATPTATSRCLCGWDRSAVGRRRVLALIDAHAGHRHVCPLRTPQEGRNAA
ncbi:hypothetical protein GCM10014715_04900 [Streptomyces spiralis]|uniref:Uncharacterized protein n=1 Tax=Streptomyces spiralis TaxID=66376 RepID=A0A918ZIM2_9ACTN|nr:hypothetical protein [Streptomyces spiralis]GHE54866.1 hypothetical protein GCM10014715_04900 [Streptomyces spiralis]